MARVKAVSGSETNKMVTQVTLTIDHRGYIGVILVVYRGH